MASAQKYDLYSDRFRLETYDIFAEMRRRDPVFCQPGVDGETPLWFITRYDDALAALLDDERFVRDRSLAMAGKGRSPETIEAHMLNKEGEEHRRLRRLVAKAFTPRRVEGLRPRIQEITDELIGAVEARGRMDLIEDLSFPLSITVIARLLGIPPADSDRFSRWSDAVVTPALDEEANAEYATRMGEFIAYLRELIARRRARPEDDLVSAMLHVEDETDRLTEAEVISTVLLLMVAGHETTVNAIANGVLVLLEHPDQLSRLLDDPDLLPPAIEELLRFEGPVERSMMRWAAADVELRGRTIRRGDRVVIVLGAANHDEDRFPDAGSFDLERRDRKHLAFGQGSHYCLGAPLARLEMEIALRTLFRRLPGMRLAVPREELTWRPLPMFRSLTALPLAW
jgi:cytochrome P450